MKKILLVVMAIMLCSYAYCKDIDSLKEAAEQGDVFAQSSLGSAYAKGKGVPQDYEEAVKWYQKAAEQGDSFAQLMLGSAYGLGGFAPQDYEESVKWYRKAAEQGDSHAQLMVGRAYENGTGVPQDYAEAYFWLNLAGSKSRDNVVAKLTPAKVEEVKARCKEWLEDFQERNPLYKP